MRGLVAVLLVVLSGCVAVRPAAQIPVVPMTFDNNLATTRQCEFRGAVVSDEEAALVGANLLLGVIYSSSAYTSGSVTTTASGWSAVKAVRCPPEVVAAMVAGGAR